MVSSLLPPCPFKPVDLYGGVRCALVTRMLISPLLARTPCAAS